MASSIYKLGDHSTRSSTEATIVHADSTCFREVVIGLAYTHPFESDANGANDKTMPSKRSNPSKPKEVWMKDVMDKKFRLPFKAGQSAEARSFEVGFRGAWFRCKIKEISCRRGHWDALLEYFDYPDEELAWTKLYQVPPYQSGKSEKMRQLMLRPKYPPIQPKNRVSDVSSNSDATVIVDGTWKSGDMVDWWNSDCYWSGKLKNLLGNGKAEIELVPPPLGEGGTYEVLVKDLRPSLDWSPNFGWAMPASLDGDCQRSKLLKPVGQGHAVVEGRRHSKATAGLSSSTSFSTRLSSNSLLGENRDFKTTEFVECPSGISDSIADLKVDENRSKDTLNQTTSYAPSSSLIFAKSLPPLDEKRGYEHIVDSKEVANKSKGSIWSRSESGSHIAVDAAKSVGNTDKDPYYSIHPLKKFRTSGEIQLNSMKSDSLEAAIMDLEELANKISWLKGIMECGRPLSDDVRPSWKFVEHYGTATHE